MNANVIAESCDVRGHAKKCRERFCDLTHKSIEQSFQGSTPCIDDHQVKARGAGNGKRITQRLLANRPGMPLLDGHRQTGHSLVRISAGATEKIRCSENLCISSWSCDVEGHAKKCVERYCELANKTTQQLYKVATPCIMHFRPPIQGRSNGICWRTNHCLLTNCSEMSVFGSYWFTSHFYGL